MWWESESPYSVVAREKALTLAEKECDVGVLAFKRWENVMKGIKELQKREALGEIRKASWGREWPVYLVVSGEDGEHVAPDNGNAEFRRHNDTSVMSLGSINSIDDLEGHDLSPDPIPNPARPVVTKIDTTPTPQIQKLMPRRILKIFLNSNLKEGKEWLKRQRMENGSNVRDRPAYPAVSAKSRKAVMELLSELRKEIELEKEEAELGAEMDKNGKKRKRALAEEEEVEIESLADGKGKGRRRNGKREIVKRVKFARNV